MTPEPKTKAEQAEDFDVAAKIAYDKQDYVFASTLAQHAHLLRMQDQKEREHDQLKTD